VFPVTDRLLAIIIVIVLNGPRGAWPGRRPAFHLCITASPATPRRRTRRFRLALTDVVVIIVMVHVVVRVVIHETLLARDDRFFIAGATTTATATALAGRRFFVGARTARFAGLTDRRTIVVIVLRRLDVVVNLVI
jgi:hypothetical protein